MKKSTDGRIRADAAWRSYLQPHEMYEMARMVRRTDELMAERKKLAVRMRILQSRACKRREREARFDEVFK